MYRFKANDSEINLAPLCLGNVSKVLSVDNMKKIRLYGYIYDLSVDYHSIEIDDVFRH